MESNSGCWDRRSPRTIHILRGWCHPLVPWPECQREAGGHWVCSWFSVIRREPSLCALKLLCLANQGTANGDDWKNCFKSLVQAKGPMLLDARTPITVSATPLNFSWRKLGFACESCPVLSFGRIKWNYFRQQHTTEAAFQMNIQQCSELYFDITVIAELY